MGRKKSYDRDDITHKAMRLFWERGYHATSTRDLTDAMDVNAYSLYAEFGSKQGLYEAAMARYEDIVVQGHFGGLEVGDASLEAVRSVLDYFGGNGSREGSHVGCLVCNASTERAPSMEKSEESTARFVDKLTGGFGHALRNAVQEGRLSKTAPVDELASFFCTVVMGIFVLSRARVAPEVIRATADQALAHLSSLAA